MQETLQYFLKQKAHNSWSVSISRDRSALRQNDTSLELFGSIYKQYIWAYTSTIKQLCLLKIWKGIFKKAVPAQKSERVVGLFEHKEQDSIFFFKGDQKSLQTIKGNIWWQS